MSRLIVDLDQRRAGNCRSKRQTIFGRTFQMCVLPTPSWSTFTRLAENEDLKTAKYQTLTCDRKEDFDDAMTRFSTQYSPMISVMLALVDHSAQKPQFQVGGVWAAQLAERAITASNFPIKNIALKGEPSGWLGNSVEHQRCSLITAGPKNLFDGFAT